MKEKTKKILKSLGLGLGSIAILALGVGIGACSVKNGSTQPVTTTPIRKGLNQRPKNAPDSLNGYNLLDEGVTYVNSYLFANPQGGNCNRFVGYRTIQLTLDSGYYYLDTSNNVDNVVITRSNTSFISDFEEWYYGSTNAYLIPPEDVTSFGLSSFDVSKDSRYVYLSETSVYWFSGLSDFKLYFVNTLEVPSSGVINFPSNWSPMSLVSDNLSVKGGYAFVDVSPATYQTQVPITITLKQNLFRYDGKVYDEMVFTFVDLSHGDGYIQDDGQPWKPWEKTTSELSSSLHVFGLYSLRFNASFNGDNIVALSPVYSDSPFQTGGDGTYYPPTVYLPTGEYRWVNPKVTYIEIVDENFGQGSTRFNQRYSDYSDLELLVYLNGYSSEGNYLAVGASGGVFEIFTNAFNSVIPLLSVQVLPSISLGILLFLPLIGGIIVVIIRVIKK